MVFKLRSAVQLSSATVLAGSLFCGLALAQKPDQGEKPEAVPAATDDSAPSNVNENENDAAPPAQNPPADKGPAIPGAPAPAPATAPSSEAGESNKEAPADEESKDRDVSDDAVNNRDANRSEKDRSNAARSDRPVDDSARPKDANDNRGRSNDRDARTRGGNRYNTANLGLTFNPTAAGALTINDIGPRGYFGTAGFRRGDRIVSASGRRFSDQANFYVWLRTVQPGQRIPFIVLRDGRETTVYWTPTPEFVQAYAQAPPADGVYFLGIHVDERTQNAVVVAQVERDSPADVAGVRANDMILAVNNQEVRNPAEFADATASLPQDQMSNLAISRTIDVQIDPAIRQRTPVQERTSLPPRPATSAAPPVSQQPAVVAQPNAQPVPAPAPRRVGGFLRRR